MNRGQVPVRLLPCLYLDIAKRISTFTLEAIFVQGPRIFAAILHIFPPFCECYVDICVSDARS